MVNVLGRRPPPASSTSIPPHLADLLEQRLEETRAWCATRLDSAPISSRLRTPGLAPDLEEESALPALEEALTLLAASRRRALDADTGSRARAQETGRLLICELDMSIGSGEAEAASEGFFDVDDRPPWDLWLVCFGRTRPARPEEPIACLVAWVPESLYAQAEAGRRASSAGSLHWVDPV